MEKQFCPVVHFEMPYKDSRRMTDFYSKVFGWQTQAFEGGPEAGKYILATTAERDGKTGRPKLPGTINGGFYQVDKSRPGRYPSVVIAVVDIIEAIGKVEEAGGKVLGQPADTGAGIYISFLDTEGNRVAMIQPPPGM